MLHALVVTYRRPEVAAATLAALFEQSLPPERLWVVDNAPDRDLAELTGTLPNATYLPMSENLGPAGGIQQGMHAVLSEADDTDWLLLVDDDDPPPYTEAVADLVSFAKSVAPGRRLGGVALMGARFNPKRGWIERVPDSELSGVVSVDYFAGNQLPLYSVAAIRECGAFDSALFFGFEELDFGLRLRRSNWDLLVPGEVALGLRERAGRTGLGTRSPGATLPPWRDYYSARNLVVITRRYGTLVGLLVVLVGSGVVGPLRRLARRQWRGALMTFRGTCAGLAGLLGRRVEPQRKAGVG